MESADERAAEGARLPLQPRPRTGWTRSCDLSRLCRRSLRLAFGESAHAGSYKRPGQYVRVRIDDQEGFFAIASGPDRQDQVELLLKRGGKVADLLTAHKAGDSIEATGALGAGFPMDKAAERALLLCAAGSGIAPIRAVIEYVSQRRNQFGDVTLVYGQRVGGDFAFRREHAISHQKDGDVIAAAGVDQRMRQPHRVVRPFAAIGRVIDDE